MSEQGNGAALSPAEISERLEQALFEIRRVIAGQDAMLERVLVCLLAQGHLLIEGVPGLAKTLTIKTTAGVLGGSFARDPVHARPRPVRPRRDADLPARRGHVRHRARAGLLQLPARRRDQPRAREGAVGAARGDAGAPGDDRAHDLSGARAVPRHGDAEPDRVRGHVPAARGAGRPLHAQDRDRLPGARRGADDRPAPARRAARAAPGALARRAARAPGAPSSASTSTRRSSATRSGSPPRPATPATAGLPSSPTTSPSAPARAGRSASRRPPARSRSCAAATTSSVEDVHALAKDAFRHRLVLSYQALAEGVTRGAILDAVLGAVPVPQVDLARPSAA